MQSTNSTDEGGAEVAGGACVRPAKPEPLEPTIDEEHRQPVRSAFWNTSLIEPGSYSKIPERFTDEGRILTREEAVEAQRRELVGRRASAEANGYPRNSKKKYRRILETDRTCQSEFTDLHTVMLSLRQSPRVSGEWIPPLTLLSELSATVRSYVIPALRRAIPYDFEYTVVLAGTDTFATPHAHIYCWIDGAVTSGDLSHVVEGYTDRCEYAPSDGEGNEPGKAITVRSPDERQLTTETEHTYNERGNPTTGAVYVASQIPNIVNPDEATRAELSHGAVADTFDKSAVWLSQGKHSWSYGDAEPVVESQDNLFAERFGDSGNPQDSSEPDTSDEEPGFPSSNHTPEPSERRERSPENRTVIEVPTKPPGSLGIG